MTSTRRPLRRRLGIRRMIIAIDGPAASGKGTLAKRIADHWGLPCLDTGLLYRAVARDVARRLPARRRRAAAARGAQPRPRDARRSAAARRGSGRGRLHRRPDSRSARRAARVPARLRRPARRRRARRARYRHRHLPRRRRQDLRHRHARGAAPSAVSRAAGPGRGRASERPSWPTSCAGTSASRPRAAPPCGPARRRLARYLAFGYRGGIRRRCRIDRRGRSANRTARKGGHRNSSDSAGATRSPDLQRQELKARLGRRLSAHAGRGKEARAV